METTCLSIHSIPLPFLCQTNPIPQCSLGIYPFMFGEIADFKPIVETIVKVRYSSLSPFPIPIPMHPPPHQELVESNSPLRKKNLCEPYSWDEYAESFFPQAELLSQAARRAEEAGKTEDACRLYLRASAVYRIARFPAPRSDKQRGAWTRGKEVFYRGAG